MFGSSITDLPRFFNFTDAVEFYNKVKGIRGRQHIKPLKSTRRSPDEYRITAEKNCSGEIVAVYCWLYETAVLVYEKDKLIVNSYNSMTTNTFICRISPHWLGAFQQDNSQIIAVGGEGVFVGNGQTIEIPVDEAYRPVKGAVIAPKLNKIVLNKKRAAASRKSCKSVIDLAITTSKVDGYWDALMKTDEVIEDADMFWLRGVLKNGWYRTHERWDGELVHYFNHMGYPVRSCFEIIPKLKKFLYERQYNEDKCYDKFPAPYGVIPNEWEVCDEVSD